MSKSLNDYTAAEIVQQIRMSAVRDNKIPKTIGMDSPNPESTLKFALESGRIDFDKFLQVKILMNKRT
tara:strand:+ start:39 stop:242 length:204 start_codon:yes stop_codon:yes gene_type:complete